jgi:hypothetical protein
MKKNRREPCRLNLLVMRPGPGWKYLGSAVWEHTSGTRIAVGGMVRLPNMEFVSGNKWPNYADMGRCIKVNGGNRKRGIMTWALNLLGA